MAVKALALEAPYAQRTVISPKGLQPLQQSLFRKSGTAPLSQVSTTSSAPVYRRQVTGPASPSSLTTGVVARPATNSMQDATPTAASPLAQAAFQPLERRPRWASMSEGPDGNEMMSPMASQGQPAVMATTLPERRPRWASICEDDDLSACMRPQRVVTPPATVPEAASEAKPEIWPGSQSESEDEDGAGKQLARRYSWSEYPTTPLFLESAANKPNNPGAEPRIGIDIGGVLTREGDPRYRGSKDEWDESWEADGALDAVRKITQVFGPSNTFLVSKVRPGGRMHRRMELWLHETINFCEATGLPKENIIFVRTVDGPQGKGVACEKLGISHFVDDKIEVLKSIFEDEAGNSRHLVERHQGLLFHFSKGGYSEAAPTYDTSQLSPIMRRHYRPAANWTQVIKELREKIPGKLSSRKELLTEPVLRPPQPVSSRESRPPGPWEKGAMQSMPTNPEAALQWSGGRPKLVLKPRSTQPAAQIATAPGNIVQKEANLSNQAKPIQVQPVGTNGIAGTTGIASAGATGIASASRPRATTSQPESGPTWAQGQAIPSRVQAQQVPQSPTQTALRQRANTVPSPGGPSTQVTQLTHGQGQRVTPYAVAPKPCNGQVMQQVASSSQQRECSPPLSVVVGGSAVQAAVQAGAVSPSGRPKLQMKTRDPRLGPPGQVSAPIAQADPPPEPQPAQPAMQPDPAGGRPRLVLKKRTDPVQAAASAPAVAAPPAAVRVAPDPPPEPQPAQPAMQPDPAGGRPRLVLKKRTDPVQAAASAPAVAAPPAAVRVSSPPPIVQKAASPVLHAAAAPPSGPGPLDGQLPASQISSCPKAAPALQKDPAGGRPRLVLKPRTSVSSTTS